MLALTRRIGEKVIIRTPAGEKVELVITNIQRGKVRLNFDGPRNLKINREEIDRLAHPEDYA